MYILTKVIIKLDGNAAINMGRVAAPLRKYAIRSAGYVRRRRSVVLYRSELLRVEASLLPDIETETLRTNDDG